jgi:hypothetical protein
MEGGEDNETSAPSRAADTDDRRCDRGRRHRNRERGERWLHDHAERHNGLDRSSRHDACRPRTEHNESHAQLGQLGKLSEYVAAAKRGSGPARAALVSALALVPVGAGINGPQGVTSSVYAIGLPQAAAFALDTRGRLWVASSGLREHKRDGVYVVERAGARAVKVVSGVTAPLGLAWYRNKLYVASLGRVDAYSGLHGLRFTRRETILNGPVTGGENNNLVVSPDGRMLMGVSASCDHCVPSSRYSAAIVSFRPDGSDLRVYARGIRAGFGLAYVPGTSDLLVSMNQRDDLGAKTPGDWLGRVREGQSWGFPACWGQGGAVCKGVPKPVAVLDKHAAAGGVAFANGDALVSEWQLGKVLRVTVRTGKVAPFLTGLKHPLPLLTLRDGSVLVGDWGTGTIYRVTTR